MQRLLLAFAMLATTGIAGCTSSARTPAAAEPAHGLWRGGR